MCLPVFTAIVSECLAPGGCCEFTGFRGGEFACGAGPAGDGVPDDEHDPEGRHDDVHDQQQAGVVRGVVVLGDHLVDVAARCSVSEDRDSQDNRELAGQVCSLAVDDDRCDAEAEAGEGEFDRANALSYPRPGRRPCAPRLRLVDDDLSRLAGVSAGALPRSGRPGGSRLGGNPRRGAGHEPPGSDSQLGLRCTRRIRARLRLAPAGTGVAAGGPRGALGAGVVGRRPGAATRGDIGPRYDRTHRPAGRGRAWVPKMGRAVLKLLRSARQPRWPKQDSGYRAPHNVRDSLSSPLTTSSRPAGRWCSASGRRGNRARGWPLQGVGHR